MADLSQYPVLSVCASVGSKLSDIPLQDGRLIFVQDKHRIALDYNGKRKFYNQIEELSTEKERTSLLAPITGMYYFVIETAIFWAYQGEWVQITTSPEEIVFIGTELPELGQAKDKTLYVNKAGRNISVYDSASNAYVIVSDYTQEATEEDIASLFV